MNCKLFMIRCHLLVVAQKASWFEPNHAGPCLEHLCIVSIAEQHAIVLGDVIIFNPFVESAIFPNKL